MSWNAVGSTSYSSDDQVVDLKGGGFCGVNSLPNTLPAFNQNGGEMALVYSP